MGRTLNIFEIEGNAKEATLKGLDILILMAEFNPKEIPEDVRGKMEDVKQFLTNSQVHAITDVYTRDLLESTANQIQTIIKTLKENEHIIRKNAMIGRLEDAVETMKEDLREVL